MVWVYNLFYYSALTTLSNPAPFYSETTGFMLLTDLRGFTRRLLKSNEISNIER